MKVKCLEYIKEFKCIGTRCTDNCCVGWDVDVDYDTFKKYKSEKNSPLLEKFNKDVVKNKRSYDKSVDYGNMILKADKRCPFLNNKMLCDIQLCHGEDYLSKVCNGYPRIANKLDETIEVSATISCPEVARMVLLNKSGLKEIEEDMDSSRMIIRNQVNTNDENLLRHPARYFKDFRAIAMWIVKNRKYTPLERIRLLGIVHFNLLPIHTEGDLEEIPRIVDELKSKIDRGIFDNFAKEDKSDYKVQVEYFSQNTEILDNDDQVRSQSFGKILSLSKKGLEINNGKLSKMTLRIYEDNMGIVNDFIEKNPHILENYLVNFMYSEMYPFSEEGDPYAGFTMLLIRIFLLKSVLAGLCSEGKQVDSNLMVELIQSFSKTLEHHKTYMNQFLYYIMESGEDDLEFLMKLI